MGNKTHRADYAKLDAIYAQLPAVACRGLCGHCCGPVPMTVLEAERLRRADRERRPPAVSVTLRCVYLTPRDRCGVYPVRPLICRAFGVLKSMSCMHGCEPDRWLTDHEFLAAAQAIERIGGPIVVSALSGLERRGDSFLDINPAARSPELAEVLAERTRVLRILHGGRIIGVTPRADDGTAWIDVDKDRK